MPYRCRVQPEAIIVIFLVSISKIYSEKSLFDELPLNGALLEPQISYKTAASELRSVKVPPSQVASNNEERASRTQETSTPPSLFDELPNQGALPQGKSRSPRDSVDFDVTRIPPSNEFDLPYWDSRLLTPIVNSISKPHHQNVAPINRVPFLPNHRGPKHHPGFRNSYGPPPPPPRATARTHSYFYNNNNNYHHRGPPPLRQQHHREEFHGRQTQNTSHHHVSATSGGPTVIVYAHPKKDAGSSSSSDQSSAYPSPPSDSTQPKNEIHYHYHINGEESTAKPGSGYAPSSAFSQQDFSNSEKSRPNTQAYGPPPTRRGPYPDSRQTRHHQDSRSTYSNTDSSNSDAQDEEDDFSRRTFFTPSKGPSNSYRPADTVSLTRPSTSYEIPPSFNAPSSTYHAPSSNYGPPNLPPAAPETSYGPPTPPTASPPAPPPPSSDAEGGDQFETTITLQTIPITRQVTELVQVPNVVHKISSNRPSSSSISTQVSDQPSQDESVSTPSPIYGPPSRQNKKVQPQPPRTSPRFRNRGNERPFDSHLEQILGVGPTQNPKDTVLQELLLGQARNPGYDMTLSDLELVQLLQGSRGTSALGGGQFPILNPGRNLFGGLFGGSSRGADTNFLNPLSLQSRGTGNSDALGSLREAFREQRLQLALSDLRRQVREQNRDNNRERTGYRSLFTRGALLLSALTLLPSFVNPMAAAAGVGSAAAASTIPNFMLPVTAAGRRKRSVSKKRKHSIPDNPFEKCLEDVATGFHGYNHTVIPYHLWVACAKHLSLTEPMSPKIRTQNLNGLVYNPGKYFSEIELLNGVITRGNVIPDLKKFLHPEDLVKSSKCIQRDFCKSILDLEKLSNTNNVNAWYHTTTRFTGSSMKLNPWIRSSLDAARSQKCDVFYCSQDRPM